MARRPRPSQRGAAPRPAPAAAAAPQMSLFIPDPGAAAAGSHTLPEASPGAAMWQVHDAYIFAETRAGILIVDQRAAHERILFEETLSDAPGEGSASQRLLFPATLRLPPAQMARLEELLGLFARIGYELEPRPDGSVLVHAVPQPHPHFDAERCLREMIAELTDGSERLDAARSQHQRLALSFAVRAAIRAGQRLSAREMGELFDRLFATRDPYRDTEGRPTLVQLSLEELRGRFGEAP